MSRRKAVIVTIALFVGALHFIIGPDYRGPFHVYVHSYLIDILLPFSMYLVAGLIKHPYVGASLTRAIAVFFVGITVETLQYYGFEIFGRTFDPVDYLMYGVGVLSGIAFEWSFINRLSAGGSKT